MSPVDQDKMILEIDGPPMAYFEIPLDWTQGFIEEDCKFLNKLARLRMHQRILYMNFSVEVQTFDQGGETAKRITERVRRALVDIDGIPYGIIWWRTRPEVKRLEDDEHHRMRMRLGTSPSLPAKFWTDLQKKEGSRDIGI